jgi:hypothetical protein
VDPPNGPLMSGPAGKNIPCWGERRLELSFSGRRFQWTFLLAAVQFPILGIDFLRNFRLLVDPAVGSLLFSHPSSSLQVAAAAVKAPPGSAAAVPQVATCGPPSSFQSLLESFPDVVNPSKKLPVTSHGVCHHIVTTGPPVAAKFRRLDREKLAAAKAEFAAMERDGIVQRSSSPWSSPYTWFRRATVPGGHAATTAV